MKRNLLIVIAVVVVLALGIFVLNMIREDDSSDDTSNTDTSLIEDIDDPEAALAELGEEDEPEGALIPGDGFEVAVFETCDIAYEFDTQTNAGVPGALSKSSIAGDSSFTIRYGFETSLSAEKNTLTCRSAAEAKAVAEYTPNELYSAEEYSKEDLCEEMGILEDSCSDIQGSIITFTEEDGDIQGFSFIAEGQQYELTSNVGGLNENNSWQFMSTIPSVQSVDYISKVSTDNETIIYEF